MEGVGLMSPYPCSWEAVDSWQLLEEELIFFKGHGWPHTHECQSNINQTQWVSKKTKQNTKVLWGVVRKVGMVDMGKIRGEYNENILYEILNEV